jgi:hypothetical protein
MAAIRGSETTSVAISDVAGRRKLIPPGHELLRAAEAIGTILR